MFYSQRLLSKKGPLGSIWVAAHCFKRLKKEQVKQTDISSSIDTILNDEEDVVTYRILGFLLLGVVRIYSKKVEFLFHDCRDMLDKLCNFTGDKIVNKSIKSISRSYHSITLPERFELDAFDLDILEDQDVSRRDRRSHEDIILADASRGGLYCKNDKYYSQGDIPHSEAFSSAYSSVRDVCSPWFMDIDLDTTSTHDVNNLNSCVGKLGGTCLSLEKFLEPMMLGDVEKVPGFSMSSDELRQTDGQQIKHHDVEINCPEPARMEKSIDNESAEPMTLGDAEKKSGFDMPSDEGHQTDGEQMKHPDLEIDCHAPARMEKSIDNESVEPMILADAEKESGFDIPSVEGQGQIMHPGFDINCEEPARIEESMDNERSAEKLRGIGFSPVDHLQPVFLNEVEKDSSVAMPSKEVGEQIKRPDTRTNFEEPEEMRLPEITSFRNQIQENCSLSITVDVTPDFKFTAGSGAASPEFIAVHTPATKERTRVLKKRKCLFDENVVFSNKVIKDWIDDSSDLVCKRRKAPPTAFHAWKVHKIYTLPRSFLEPLIPCNWIDFRSLVSQKTSTTRVSGKTAETPVNPVLVESLVTQMSVETAETHVNRILVESPAMQMSGKTAETPVNRVLVESSATQMSHEQTPIAPATPVTHSTSLRLNEVRGVSKPDMLEPSRSFVSIEKQPTCNEDRELDIGLMDEEVNSSVGYNTEKCAWSMRTRRVATYLHQNISNLTKQKRDGIINLHRVLEGRTRTESARLFYEILALKTGDYIDVRQEDAYADILVLGTPKLKETIDSDGIRSRA